MTDAHARGAITATAEAKSFVLDLARGWHIGGGNRRASWRDDKPFRQCPVSFRKLQASRRPETRAHTRIASCQALPTPAFGAAKSVPRVINQCRMSEESSKAGVKATPMRLC